MKKATITAKSYSNASYILPQPVQTVATTKQVDAEEAAWRKANNYEKPLTNQEYFNIYGTWR